MSKIELAAQYVENVCANDSIGYDQNFRYLNTDVDCSSLQCFAWQNAGVPVIDYGCSYTGNMTRFLDLGFINVVDKVNLFNGYGLERGDVLLTVSGGHTAMYLGNNLIGQATSNEFGGIVGGQPGDQTGFEVAISGYANFYSGWEYVLRYVGESEEAKKEPIGIGRVVNLDGDTLNVRSGAGITYPIINVLGEGNMVEICDQANGWYYVRVANTYYGWISADFVEAMFFLNVQNVGKVSGVYPYTLNVRTGPGVDYPILNEWPALGEENAVEILSEDDGWYKVKIANQFIGYVSSKYIRR